MAVFQKGVGRRRQPGVNGYGLIILFGQLINRVIPFIIDINMAVARIELDAAALTALQVFFDIGCDIFHIVLAGQAVDADAIAHVIGIVMLF